MDSEISEGYVVDIACIRKYPRNEIFEKSEVHSRACALMGHCMESGYGLVNEHGVTLLDDEATPMIAEALLNSNKDCGIRIRVERTKSDGEMHTVRAEEVP